MTTPAPGPDVPANTRPHTARLARSQRPERPRRPWPVTANALLLLLGAAGFLFMAAALLRPLGMRWPLTPELWQAHRGGLVAGFAFVLLAMLALAATLGFVRVARGAWLLAVLVQGLNLGLALVLYFSGRPTYVYVMMVYGIVMVLYLHQADVQAAFRTDTLGSEAGQQP
jgi:hypothetical protein